MVRYALIWVFWMVAVSFTLNAAPAGINPLENGPIHEAWATKVTGTYILEAVPVQPPKEVLEHIPPHSESGLEWIKGYWKWHSTHDDFIWVAGIWRRPPPGHQWSPGFWTEIADGWVWIRGYWTDLNQDEIQYIGVTPPDQPDENPGNPPSDGYFWAPGYYEYDWAIKSYSWLMGQWQVLDPHWILVPAHYVWRPDGWVFVAAYWDWPVDYRGIVYASLWIEPEVREIVEYVPWIIIDSWDCMQRLYVYYPDYPCFFHHHWHYYSDQWENCGCTPSWWYSPTWWCYNWHQCWALWWWYCHPGYPQPYWMTDQMAMRIVAPSKNILNKWHQVATPPFVTPKGVVKPSVLLKALGQVTDQKNIGKIKPILPNKSGVLHNMQNVIDKQTKLPKHIIKPIGRPGNRPVMKKPDIKLDNTAATSQVRVKGWLPGKMHLPTDAIKGLNDKLHPRAPVEIPHVIHIPKEPPTRFPKRPPTREIEIKEHGHGDRPPFIDPRTLIKGHKDIFPGPGQRQDDTEGSQTRPPFKRIIIHPQDQGQRHQQESKQRVTPPVRHVIKSQEGSDPRAL